MNTSVKIDHLGAMGRKYLPLLYELSNNPEVLSRNLMDVFF